MQAMNLAGIDLNLLVVFDALLAERNVTRAARRVGLSQPAMSHALRRLRAALGDPVLVRTTDGMAPTQRALELYGPVHTALEQVGQALGGGDGFDPATARRTFTVGTADYVEYVMLPVLNAWLAAEAPSVDLVIKPITSLPADELRAGALDLAIGVFGEAPVGLDRRRLFDERLVCVVRRDHPRVGKRLTLKRFAELGHVLVAPMGRPGSVVDPLLAEQGLRRRVVVTTPHFLVAPVVVARSDLVTTIAERVARTFAEQLPLKVLRPPLEMPNFTISMVWHNRNADDVAHRWIRSALAQIGRTL